MNFKWPARPPVGSRLHAGGTPELLGVFKDRLPTPTTPTATALPSR
jgi:hypothetical protein